MKLNADRLCLPDPFCMSTIDFRPNFREVSGDKARSDLTNYGRSVQRFHDPIKYLAQFSNKLCRNRLCIAPFNIFIKFLRCRKEINLESVDCLASFKCSSGTTAFLRVNGFGCSERPFRSATSLCLSEKSNVQISVFGGLAIRKGGRSSFTLVTSDFQLFIRGFCRLMLLVLIGKVAIDAPKRNCHFDRLFPVLESVIPHMALDQDRRNEGICVLRQHVAAMPFEGHLGLQLGKAELTVKNCGEMHLLMQWPRQTTSGCVEHRTKSNGFVKNAAGRVSPAVVRLDTERICATRNPAKHDFSTHVFGDELVRDSNEFIRERGMGSGFVVDAENGLIVTNLHVIDGAANVKVIFCDGKEFNAQIIGVDEISDLAIMKVSNQAGELLPEAPLGNSKTVELGDWVIAIGNPFGLDNTISLGIISNLHRTASEVGISGKQFDLFQTDCAINPGSSGGPLVNEFGEVIGINTAIRADAEGIAFAIPINNVKHVIEALSKGSSM